MVKKNPLNISKESNYVFVLNDKNYKSLLKNIEDFNLLKPSPIEINSFNEYIKNISDSVSNKKTLNNIEICEEYKDALEKFTPGIHDKNEDLKAIENIILTYKKREKLTIKKLKRKFIKLTNKKISKTKLYYLIKNKLGFKFLKTCPKTKILQKSSSILKGFIFIKTFIRCINEGLIPVYIDETNFQINNNNLKVWRLKKEFLFFNIGKSDRRNLILAVTPNKTLHYEINKGTNKSKDFLKFFDSLLKKIPKNDLKNYLFIMDNCSIHLNKELLEFYEKNKLKIITIVPYFSQLNSVELNFRFIKQILYKNVYKNTNKMINEVENIINSLKFNKSLPKLYLETLRCYLNFINNYSSINLNLD